MLQNQEHPHVVIQKLLTTMLPAKIGPQRTQLAQPQRFALLTLRSRGYFPLQRRVAFLAIDVETASRLKWRGSRGKSPPDALDPRKCELRILSAATPDGNVVIHDFRTGLLPDDLRTALATTPLLAHNAAFDLAVLQANGTPLVRKCSVR